MLIAVIDYGMGNLRSVARALERVAPDHDVVVTSDPAIVLASDRVVFPGQGAMPDCMRELDARGLRAAVLEALPGEVRRFVSANMVDAAGRKLKVPHMGWNTVHQTRPHPLWDGIPQDERFYFVHSYHVVPADDELAAARTPYPAPFVSAANIFAVQFHPEKSHSAGLRLLANFIAWNVTARDPRRQDHHATGAS